MSSENRLIAPKTFDSEVPPLKTSEPDNPNICTAREICRSHRRMLRTRDALDNGIRQHTLYTMRDSGILERIERGLNRLSELPPLSIPDLVTVARKIPKGVICLLSALHFHNITTQIPHRVSIAVSRGTEAPGLNFPTIHTYWFSGEAFTTGMVEHIIDDTKVRVFSPEKHLLIVLSTATKSEWTPFSKLLISTWSKVDLIVEHCLKWPECVESRTSCERT